MPKSQALIDLSSSVSIFADRKDLKVDNHFRWDSIKRFLYLAFTFSSSVFNFDIYSKVCDNVRILDSVLCAVTAGIAYMYMDFFIKQYTRRLDCNKYLNPLLRGISFGMFLQTGLWTLIHATYLADGLRFFVSGLQEVPSWSLCQPEFNSTCVAASDLMLICKQNRRTKFSLTSAYFNYFKAFSDDDRNIMTSRLFVIALVWICNFFLASVTEEFVIKIFKLAFICRTVSTVTTIVFIVFASDYDTMEAITQIMNISSPHSYTLAMNHACYTYGIGFLGLFDFGSMSAYTMIDNAVIIFMVLFIIVSFVRSWIVTVMYNALTKCVEVEISLTSHLLFFAILPLSTEFFYAHKLYVYYIYLNLMIATLSYVTMMTLILSKFLQNEFRTIKPVYIVGMLCSIGFGLSVPITMVMTGTRVWGLVLGLNVNMLYLGGFKVAIVMWVYGVRRFSTDILFWLGFKPTKYWTICWILMPIWLLSFTASRVYDMTTMSLSITLVAYICIGLTLLVVLLFQIKTIARYLVQNNLVGAFVASEKYGPPDPEDRKKRRVYNEILRLRKCKHNCMLLDEMFDCHHMPLKLKSKTTLSSSSSEPSLTNIFEAAAVKNLPSSSQMLAD